MRLTILLLLLPLFGAAQDLTLSDRAQIHIVTCGPGQEELYSAFGHSAIRVVDPETGLDVIYNYGVFDFNQPNFYLNFARGYLNYRLLRQGYEQFRDAYIYYDRTFIEQRLDLSQGQKQKLFDFLEWNNKPENRYYFYDYFYDNCATRIVDAVIISLGDEIEFDGSHITDDKTIRELTDDLLIYQPWGDLGIDICLGIPMDKIASPEMHRFLPEYVKLAFDNAYIVTDSSRRPLVSRTFEVYTSKSPGAEIGFFTPMKTFWALFILILGVSIFEYRRKKWFRWIDITWFSVLSFLGVFLTLLWLATDHNAAAWNLNILWALPVHIFTVYLIVKRRNHHGLFRFLLFWYLALILGWGFLPQLMHHSLLAFCAISLIRIAGIKMSDANVP